KRSFAYGMKMVRKKNVTVKEETIDDAVLAVKMLKEDARIDPEQVYILGHSMGAMLAGRIDAEGADVKGLIMMAGSPCRLEEILLRQLQQASSWKSLMQWIIGLELKAIAGKFTGLYQMSDEEAKKIKMSGGVTLYYFKEMGRKTAVDYLLEHEKPVLIMQGGKDFQALADEDFHRFQELLAGRNNTSFRLYPDLNHCFVKAIYDDINKASKEYRTERHIEEDVIRDIADFIHAAQTDKN
ncbi:MAG: alpha/beta fold hydrolase, partial [Solobacterium sp.]|nr:alpha/beta fold hydrolase [Solobacterium sp.]